ncbi:MAG: O-antigen ligase domain-containing protein [Alphaproteobacteria bacterium]|nr:O-antigen ligase domain-containing protein [Alphaproteobacteria bacterium]
MAGKIRFAPVTAAPTIARESSSVGRDVLLAIGLLLTTATQFRLPGSPFGPGEVFLVGWIALMLIFDLGGYTPLTSAFRRLLTFWALFALAQSVGTLTGMMIGDQHDPSLFIHDVLAYPLVAALSCLSVIEPGAARRLRRCAEISTGLGAVCLVPQLMIGWDLISLPILEPWFGDRLRGWSNNPNQLAFLCAVLVLVSLHLADTADRASKRSIALLCMIPPILVGRLTKTDTFTFALLGAVPIYLVAKLRFWLGASERRASLRTVLAWVAVIGVPLLLVSAVPFALSSSGNSDQLAMGLMKGGGKEASAEADLRLALWREAIERGVQSYMLGLGPGPHLPIPPEIIAARMTEPDLDTGDHPALNATPNFEAHNSPLDLFTQGGLLADVSFVWLLAMACIVPYRARLAGLVALLAGVAIFGLTNNIVRPPMFWFAVALCLVSDGRADGVQVGRRPPWVTHRVRWPDHTPTRSFDAGRPGDVGVAREPNNALPK